MSHNYPDPSAGPAPNVVPFYTQAPPQQQQQRRSSNEIELSQLAHDMNASLGTRQLVPQMGQNVNGHDPRQVQPTYQDYVTAQYQTPQQQLAHTDPNIGTNSAGQDPAGLRKKAKVSRACDECRRKKIRCEFPTENPAPTEKCSNCIRTTSNCAFSRMPQKRGPSKGYIKELADKLAHLENHVMGPQAGQANPSMDSSHSSPQASNEFARTADMDFNRKRNHSASEDLSPQDYLQHAGTDRFPPQGGWATQHGADQTPQYATGYYPPNTPQNGYADLTQFPTGPRASMTSNASGLPNAQTQSSAHSTTNMNMETANPNFEWNKDMIAIYYQSVHKTLPLIAHSTEALHYHLSSVSAPVREAFLEAVYTVVHQSSQTPYTEAQFVQISQKVHELLTKSQISDSGSGPFYQLVRFQTAILMVMAIDVCGPIKTLGFQRGMFFGIANGIAHDLNLHINPITDYNQGMTDSVDVVNRRAWWSLIVLDRWYAAGMAKPYQIADDLSKLTAEDPKMLGKPFYHLARLSLVLSHISMTFRVTEPNRGILSAVAAGALDRVRESVDDIVNLPTLNMAYLHVQHLCERHRSGPDLEVATIAGYAQQIASNLNAVANGRAPDIGVPLKHHVTGLAVITLIECLDMQEFKERSLKLQGELQDSIEKKGLVSNGWAGTILNYMDEKLSQVKNQHSGTDSAKGLQHLAEIATEKADKIDEAKNRHTHGALKDWTASTRSGYLTTLS